MADAKKCDRCGAFFDIPKRENEREGWHIAIVRKWNSGNISRIYDLCPKCEEALNSFYAEPEVAKMEVNND